MSKDLDTSTTDAAVTDAATTETDRTPGRLRVAALINSAAALATAIAFVSSDPPKIPSTCGD